MYIYVNGFNCVRVKVVTFVLFLSEPWSVFTFDLDFSRQVLFSMDRTWKIGDFCFAVEGFGRHVFKSK